MSRQTGHARVCVTTEVFFATVVCVLPIRASCLGTQRGETCSLQTLASLKAQCSVLFYFPVSTLSFGDEISPRFLLPHYDDTTRAFFHSIR